MFKALNYLLLASFVLATSACSDSEKTIPTKPPVSFKPLPQECFSSLDVLLFWGNDPDAHGYQLDYGYLGSGVSDVLKKAAPATGIQLPLERGATHVLALTRQDIFGRIDYRQFTVEIPTCENREEFQRKNPSYEEPIQYQIRWTP